MKEKRIKYDEQTRRALDEIRRGDKVIFHNCQEAIIFKGYSFHVISEYPTISENKRARYVEVELRNFGWVNIEKLLRVEEPFRFSDFDVEKGAACCLKEQPDCTICPYNKLGILACKKELDKDVVKLLRRRDAFFAQKAVQNG